MNESLGAGASALRLPISSSVHNIFFEHHFAEVEGERWHYVEAGAGEAVVFLHGFPEYWYAWHHQLEALSADYHVIALDLKGFGQSHKNDGDYSPEGVAAEIIRLLGNIGLERFHLVTYELGSVIGDAVAGSVPNRVLSYVRMQLPVARLEPFFHTALSILGDPALAPLLLTEPEDFLSEHYGARTQEPLQAEDYRRLVTAFSRPGVAEAVPRYARALALVSVAQQQERFSRMTMPVLLLQGDMDFTQPLRAFAGATDLFPDARLQWVIGAGHAPHLEKPAAVTAAIDAFLALTSGVA